MQHTGDTFLGCRIGIRILPELVTADIEHETQTIEFVLRCCVKRKNKAWMPSCVRNEVLGSLEEVEFVWNDKATIRDEPLYLCT